MRVKRIFLNALLFAATLVESQPVHRRSLLLSARRLHPVQDTLAKRGEYQAVTAWEKKGRIALITVSSVLAAGLAAMLGMEVIDHKACMYVQRQEETMQASWDLNHPDGFIPLGGQMRPITFRCKKEGGAFRKLPTFNPAGMF